MNFIQQFVSEELIYAVGWTVVHSLWQGFLIAFLLLLAMQFLRKRSAKLRYEVSGLALFLMLITALCTFIGLYDHAGTQLAAEVQAISTGDVLSTTATEASLLGQSLETWASYFNEHLPLIVIIWLAGVAFFLLRLLGGLAYVQHLKHYNTSPLPVYWQNKMQGLMRRIPLRKAVMLVESSLVKVPMVIGFFKPVILLPIGAINQLSENEVEAILAHELAHIIRNDFLINIFISFIEVLFYFNPAVWWISGNIRLERENCSDDIAIRLCGSSISYAKALVSLQELDTSGVPSFAMPFSNRKNQLLNRVRRILNQPQNRSNMMEKLMATCLLVIGLFLFSVGANSPANNASVHEDPDVDLSVELELDEEVEDVNTFTFQDTVPDHKEESVSTKELQITKDGKKYYLKSRNGELQVLRIDGQEIPDSDFSDYADLVEELMNYPLITPSPQIQGSITPAFPKPSAPRVAPNPSVKIKPSGKALKYRFNTKDKQRITSYKNDDNETVIVVEGNDLGEAVEIVVDREEDIIIVEGNELEEGDTAEIIYEVSPGAVINLRTFDHHDDLDLDTDHHLSWNEETIEEWKNELGEEDILAYEYLHEPLKTQRLEDLYSRAEDLSGQLYLLKMLPKNDFKSDASILRGRPHTPHSMILPDNDVQFFIQGHPDVGSKMEQKLLLDGLIKDTKNYRFQLNGKRMKVNGKKQPKAIWKQYKKYYETLTGKKLNGKSGISISKSED